jgi:hypothetical protein
VTWTATCGGSYLIQVGGFNGAQGSTELTITSVAGAPVQPGNDLCANAIAVGAGVTAYSNCGATDDGPQPCGAIGSDVWFVYTATSCNASITFTTCSARRTYDTVLAVYGACGGCPVGAALGCNDDDGNCANGCVPFFGSTVTLNNCTAGGQYLIQVGGFVGQQGCSELTITETPPPAPANDLCANAAPVGNGVTGYSNCGANSDGPQPCGGIGSDVWFSYST